MGGHDTILGGDLRQDRLRGEDGHVAITAQGGGVGGKEEAIFVAMHDGFLRVRVRCGDCSGAGDEDDESVKEGVRGEKSNNVCDDVRAFG